MRIAFDHQIFGWQAYGGISRYAYELARALANQYGQHIDVISPFYVNQYLRSDARGLHVWGLPIHQIPRTGRMIRAINSLAVNPILSAISPDIVHETYYAMRRSGPRPSKHVLTVHDMIHEKFSASFRSKDKTSTEKLAAVNRADHVICVSQQTQRDLIEITGIDPDKTTVVYHGFTLTSPTEAELPLSARKALWNIDRPYLLYVGNRGGYKNFDSFIRAVADSKNLRKDYAVICFGGDPFNTSEKRYLEGIGFSERDILQISGSDDVLAHLYRHASAFIYPSFYEGFGIPPLEAMSFDCPVACSRTSSIPEVVGDAGVYFDPADIEDMRLAIECIVSDTALRAKIIHRGRERISEFSWSRCAGETLDVYQRTLDQNPTSR